MTYIKIFEDHIELLIWVKPGASQNQVLKPTERGLSISVCAKAQDGKANDAILQLLSRFFNIPPTSMRILKGQRGRQKKIQLPIHADILTKLKDNT